jgi:hypothetical protein
VKSRLYKALEETSELRVFFVLLVILALRAWRIIPTLRPQQIIIPATLLQIFILVIAACFSQHFISTVAIGNFIVVGIALLPMTFPRPIKAHWVRAS